MREVVIIGAGVLGGAVADAVARRDLARGVTLVDDAGRVAAGKALDIAQSAPVEGFATSVTGSTDPSAIAGADVVVIADRFSGGDLSVEDQVSLLKRVAQMAPRAVVIVATAGGRDVVDRGVRELRLSSARLIGTAPAALVAGAKALVALALNSSAQDVAIAVLGVPPMHTIVPWEEATIGGSALTRLLDQPTRRRLDARIATLWPPGPLALAAAASQAIAAIAGRSRRSACCFVAPDAHESSRRRTAAVPVRLGAAGIVEIVWPSLTVMEQVAWDNATML